MTKMEINFPPYKRYKSSKVDWANQIPLHWKTKALKYIAKLQSGDTIRPEQFTEDGYPVFGGNGFRGYTRSFNNIGRFPLIGRQGALCGNVNYSSGYFFASEHAVVVYPRSECSVTWLGETIRAANFNRLSQSTAQPGISVAVVENQQFPYPPAAEQKAIAKFIDQKSTQIEQAIQIKLRQIDRLKERKQILIQQTVTRGLAPDTAMRDSGIEWIGQIPAHWQLKRLKYVLEECSERSRSGDEPLFMVSQVHGLVVRSEYHEKAEVAASTVGTKIVNEGDLVFNKLKAHLGVFFKSCIPFQGIVSPDYAVYRSKAHIKDLKYLEHLFRHPAYIGQFIVRATGVAEGLIRLYTTELFDMPVPVAPDDEQQEILCYIDKVSERQDMAVVLLEQQIAKLKEYKATLINSAVTGKIKVPGVVEPDIQDRELT
ncbi:type I restriction enzyme S subunit [Pseudomonas viridiflava]